MVEENPKRVLNKWLNRAEGTITPQSQDGREIQPL